MEDEVTEFIDPDYEYAMERADYDDGDPED